jgi:hypothetical protein
MPLATEWAGFIDATHVFAIGNNLDVINASVHRTVESWQPEGPSPRNDVAHHFGRLALLPNRRRAYVSDDPRHEILVLDSEDSNCSPDPNGLAVFYTGDGVLADVVGGADLSAVGGVQFKPGRVGQAFALDGISGYLVAESSGHFHFGYRDSSVALYVKFESLQGAMTILDRGSADGRPTVRLVKNSDNRLGFEFATKQGHRLLRSRTNVLADRWYHVAVTKDDGAIALYVNGALEDRQTSGTEEHVEWSPFYFGASSDKNHFFHGKLDEIMFYDRSLATDEVRRLYEKRESGVCRM